LIFLLIIIMIIIMTIIMIMMMILIVISSLVSEQETATLICTKKPLRTVATIVRRIMIFLMI